MAETRSTKYRTTPRCWCTAPLRNVDTTCTRTDADLRGLPPRCVIRSQISKYSLTESRKDLCQHFATVLFRSMDRYKLQWRVAANAFEPRVRRATFPPIWLLLMYAGLGKDWMERPNKLLRKLSQYVAADAVLPWRFAYLYVHEHAAHDRKRKSETWVNIRCLVIMEVADCNGALAPCRPTPAHPRWPRNV
eukprot:4003627-Pyramimonas_sp.AAC.1